MRAARLPFVFRSKNIRIIMTNTSNTSTGRFCEIPVSSLSLSSNIRHQIARADVDEMKASILSKGVLQNVIAAPTANGAYAVFAGQTRAMAALELLAEGAVAPDYTIPARVYDDIDPDSPDAIAIAMAENMVRTQMDYIDECSAMLQLADAKWSPEEIATVFGYRPKTVAERLLIGRLIPDAHALVRSGTRNIAWARALTIADPAMQRQIVDDIGANPQSWSTGDDVRKFLTQSTIDAAHALFDPADYTGAVVRDMFEGDKFSDIESFWALQNAAIDDLVAELEAEGFYEVCITREPHAPWLYEDCADTASALAVVEVMPNGKVNVHRNLRLVDNATTQVAAIDAADLDAANALEEIADDEVRPTKSLCEYASAHRTAIVQAEMAQCFRSALEYTVLAMLGHRGAVFSVQPYTHAGTPALHDGNAFAAVAHNADTVYSETAVEANTPEERDTELQAFVASLEDTALQNLFARLTAQRMGQTTRRGPDVSPTSLLNAFGAQVDVRSWWTPNETFFGLMATEDLRRLATALLPGASGACFASTKKASLVKTLASNFEQAADGTHPNLETAFSLNTWVPGIMSFPADVRKAQEESVFEDEDLDALLFDGVGA